MTRAVARQDQLRGDAIRLLRTSPVWTLTAIDWRDPPKVVTVYASPNDLPRAARQVHAEAMKHGAKMLDALDELDDDGL